MESKDNVIFFHLGLERTGTKFLQKSIFPFIDNITYLDRKQYKDADNIIRHAPEKKILVSYEFNELLLQEVRSFSNLFPNTHAVMVFRRHDSYIASQYRRYVKNGFKGALTDFLDLENDKGYLKKIDLDFCRKIEIVRKHFTVEPFFFNYHDLENEPEAFIKKMLEIFDVDVPCDKISYRRRHVSYDDIQLKTLKAFTTKLNIDKKKSFENKALRFMHCLAMDAVRYPLLQLGRIMPNDFFGSEPLIESQELERIRSHYETDWRRCSKEFVKV